MVFLDDGIDHLATTLLDDQSLIPLLLGVDVADAEVEYVPDHGQVGDATVFILGGRWLQRLGMGLHTLTARTTDIVTSGIPGRQRHARQHVEAGEVQLTLGQGLLHDLQAAFEVVFHRTGHGVVQGQRTAQWLLILVHVLQIGRASCRERV